MKVKVIREFTDKYSMKDIAKGEELEITEERFSELTTGPLGAFVEELEKPQQKLETQENLGEVEQQKSEETGKKKSSKDESKK
jgi:hypothetical protein